MLYQRMVSRLSAILRDPRSMRGDQMSASAALSAVVAEIQRVKGRSKEWIDRAMRESFGLGDKASEQQLRNADVSIRDVSGLNPEVVARAAAETYGDLAGRTDQIGQRLTFAIRDAGARAIRDAVARGAHPSIASRDILDALVARGLDPPDVFKRVKAGLGDLAPGDMNAMLRELTKAHRLTAFVDVAGKVWEPAGYAKMLARTKEAILYNEGAVRRQQDNGVTLCQISASAANADPLCAPWGGIICAYDAKTARRLKLPEYSRILAGGAPFHPNCRHSPAPVVEELLSERELAKAQADAAAIRPLWYVQDSAEFRRKAMQMGF